jgi:hypothetical protein
MLLSRMFICIKAVASWSGEGRVLLYYDNLQDHIIWLKYTEALVTGMVMLVLLP